MSTFQKLRLIILFALVYCGSFFMIGGASLAQSPTQCPRQDGLGALKIPTWYKYLEGEEVTVKRGDADIKICKIKLYSTDSSSIESDPATAGTALSKNISAIGLAVVEILMRILIYASIIWGIWGGYEIIVSGGNSQGFKNGVDRIRNALIGLAIGILSTSIIVMVGTRLTT